MGRGQGQRPRPRAEAETVPDLTSARPRPDLGQTSAWPQPGLRQSYTESRLSRDGVETMSRRGPYEVETRSGRGRGPSPRTSSSTRSYLVYYLLVIWDLKSGGSAPIYLILTNSVYRGRRPRYAEVGTLYTEVGRPRCTGVPGYRVPGTRVHPVQQCPVALWHGHRGRCRGDSGRRGPPAMGGVPRHGLGTRLATGLRPIYIYIPDSSQTRRLRHPDTQPRVTLLIGPWGQP